ncbi:hypothetical protein [Stenotrophomonas sp.]|uniref:hypothetical protein n=1 Tax=Stenotrophomonas sp. TaxID=69392 RepID=UPI0028AD1183|nr:hypothetical protein [Stenotrophomonas sp.]
MHPQYQDDNRMGAASLSAGVVLLLILAVLAVTLGFARLPDALLELGVVAIGLFLAVSARIYQAREQHLALCRALERLRRAR